MEARQVKKRCVIVVSTDNGLCGALNSNLLREAARFDKDNTIYVTAGRKASQFVARTKRRLAAEFTYKDAPLFSEARAISAFVREMFTKGEADQIDILFTSYVSILNQKPATHQLLPVGEIKPVHIGGGPVPAAEAPEQELSGAREFIFEPTPEAVLGAMLPHSLNFELYQILLEAKASEHSSRMVAMKNATDNAKQLIKDLTLEYNKLRQANITKELLEITTAQMALAS